MAKMFFNNDNIDFFFNRKIDTYVLHPINLNAFQDRIFHFNCDDNKLHYLNKLIGLQFD